MRFERSGFPLALCALAFLSWGPLLLNTDAIYWDDWVLKGQPVEGVARLMLSLGVLPSAVLHSTLLSLGNGIFGYRVACFVATCAIALAIFGILVRSRAFGRTDAFLIAALALVFPVNQARVAAINVPAQIYFALFMCAWYLSLRNLEKPAFWRRGLALVFFVISFSAQSLLLFYVLPIAHLFWVEARKTPVLAPGTIWRTGFRWIRANMDFLLAPFVAYLIRAVFYSPAPMYDGYNAITIEGLTTGVRKAVTALVPAFVDPIMASSPNLIVAAIFGGCALVLLLSGYFKSQAPDGLSKRSLLLIAGGLAAFVIGVYPYCAVDKIPYSKEWYSRYQLLVPFGAATLLFGLIELLSFGKRYVVLTATAYFILTFAWADLRMLHDYRLDWKKQLAIIEGLKALEPARAARGGALLFVDDAADLNASERFFRFYELSGFLRRAYGDQTRFGTLVSDCQRRNDYKQFKGEGYSIDGYEGGAVAGVIRIDRNKRGESLFDESVAAALKLFGKYPAQSDAAGSEPVRLHFIPVDAAKLPVDCGRAALSWKTPHVQTSHDG
ncbi:MAG: hypothetical protein QOD89_1135 [Bradyrhizobium sp.]|jgi:hypothetical protein|nr:hypothetical protein [Bradyrhizobium sp.]